MKIEKLPNDYVPSFCWDRSWNMQEIKTRIASMEGIEKIRLIAWVMREGTYNEIWNILNPKELFPLLDELMIFLGSKKNYWRYTFDIWRQMGKI